MQSSPLRSGRGQTREYVRRVADQFWPESTGSDGPNIPLPRKLYRVSEIAEHTGLTRQTVHNYATIGLITEEARTSGGQRLFAESVFTRLALIQRMKPSHRLHEIRSLLDRGPSPAGAANADAALSDAARRNLERSQEISSIVHRDPDAPSSASAPSAEAEPSDANRPVSPPTPSASGSAADAAPNHVADRLPHPKGNAADESTQA